MKAFKSKELNRRDFIKKSTSGIGGILFIPTILPSHAKWRGANDRLLIGHIGVGQRGTSELQNYFLKLEGSRSVAVCDVFRDRREKAAQITQLYYRENGKSSPECKSYLDFEEMLMRDDIDAVHITTVDHWHVLGSHQSGKGR